MTSRPPPAGGSTAPSVRAQRGDIDAAWRLTDRLRGPEIERNKDDVRKEIANALVRRGEGDRAREVVAQIKDADVRKEAASYIAALLKYAAATTLPATYA